ncbi:hypothetical protein C7212DRAFT_213741 [Tuber magnatum]|uniref:DUF2470 domain-containing protein n=1 Tax=Tuber magnatum TaxID=42249 RepID=A0A317SH72_9PEZI|nr:hypothetical protein C7212DRAFT_213741 [Tuber magnatum]
MAEKPTDDAALKAGIIAHMNKDRKISLSHYLQHYSKLPSVMANTAELVDISLSRITLSTRTSLMGTETATTYLPIRPSPMQNLSESGERLVYMANECLTGLGLSPYVIKTYPPPGIVGIVLMVSVLMGLWVFSDEGNLAEGSFARVYLLQNYHPLADFLMRTHRTSFLTIATTHLAECIYLQKSRLRKHQVKPFSKVWWLWIMSGALEGYGVFERFDKEVEEVIKSTKNH